jgi:hypothetical protein
MDKRYQVFISSTYADLKDERRAVIQTVIGADCIPAGMELFPAVDEKQLTFIKRVIDDCDYYLLIIGGRYGSVDDDGISYTEQEYDYAVSRGLKVIALIHSKPDEIPVGKSELDAVLREKLQKFREKVSVGRLVKFWEKPEELPGLVALSLLSTMREFPAVGWVRANKPANEAVLGEINELRKENDRLQRALAEVAPPPAIEGLAGLDEDITLPGQHHSSYHKGFRDWEVKTTWRKIFGYISPYLVEHPTHAAVQKVLASALFAAQKIYAGTSVTLDDQSFQTVAVQLQALGLVRIEYTKTTIGGMGLFWSLTPAGERLMLELRTVPTSAAPVGHMQVKT